MELRHFRYFVAVADAGSLTVAAEQKLHTSQPSLSRQIRDLELEVGVALMKRSAHGVELIPPATLFWTMRDGSVAGRSGQGSRAPGRTAAHNDLALGSFGGRNRSAARGETHVHDEFPGIDIRLSSDYSPGLAKALMRRKLDAAFMRPEENMGDLACRRVRTDPLLFAFPSDHRLASQTTIAPRGDRERDVLSSVQGRARGAPRRAGVFLPRRHRTQAGP